MALFLYLFLEKKTSTEWALTLRRCTIKDDGCYVVKAINNIGSDTKSLKILVVAAAKANNMLVSSGNDLPGGNQSGSINKNYEQSADSNSLPKLGEVSNVSYQNLIPKFVWKRNIKTYFLSLKA